MDLRRTMAFILESEARAAGPTGSHHRKTTGMKLMVEIQQAERENKAAIKQLSQRIDAFIASMEKGRNGRGTH
jgi:hypothetical protein